MLSGKIEHSSVLICPTSLCLLAVYHEPSLEHILDPGCAKAVLGELVDKSELCDGLLHPGRELVLLLAIVFFMGITYTEP